MYIRVIENRVIRYYESVLIRTRSYFGERYIEKLFEETDRKFDENK